MGVWAELVGVRKDLRLRGKWWHHVAVGVGVFSALIVYLIVGGQVVKRPPKPTTATTFSETLLNEAAARQTTTTLSDLDTLGIVGTATAEGDLVPLQRSGPSDIRCESQAKFKADQKVQVGGMTYQAIPDRAGQAPGEGRHCIATATYAALSADSVKSISRPFGYARVSTALPVSASIRSRHVRISSSRGCESSLDTMTWLCVCPP